MLSLLLLLLLLFLRALPLPGRVSLSRWRGAVFTSTARTDRRQLRKHQQRQREQQQLPARQRARPQSQQRQKRQQRRASQRRRRRQRQRSPLLVVVLLSQRRRRPLWWSRTMTATGRTTMTTGWSWIAKGPERTLTPQDPPRRQLRARKLQPPQRKPLPHRRKMRARCTRRCDSYTYSTLHLTVSR